MGKATQERDMDNGHAGHLSVASLASSAKLNESLTNVVDRFDFFFFHFSLNCRRANILMNWNEKLLACVWIYIYAAIS